MWQGVGVGGQPLSYQVRLENREPVIRFDWDLPFHVAQDGVLLRVQVGARGHQHLRVTVITPPARRQHTVSTRSAHSQQLQGGRA